MLVVKNSGASCTGSTILKDQFSNTVNQPYSVERYASAVKEQRSNSNPRDGAMLWQVLKTANAACGSGVVASPGTILQEISTLFDLPADYSRAAWR